MCPYAIEGRPLAEYRLANSPLNYHNTRSRIRRVSRNGRSFATRCSNLT